MAPDRIYEDLASGRSDARPGLAACLKALQPGNTLVLWKLDRLGRDLRHLVNTVEDLRVRGVWLKVLAGAGAQIDTTTANGRLAFGIFAAFAEFERELIAERTYAGLAAARARGRMGGRPLGNWATPYPIHQIFPCAFSCETLLHMNCGIGATRTSTDALHA